MALKRMCRWLLCTAWTAEAQWAFSVMCEHNIITQVWEFSKTWQGLSVEMCGMNTPLRVRECEQMRAISEQAYSCASFDSNPARM